MPKKRCEMISVSRTEQQRFLPEAGDHHQLQRFFAAREANRFRAVALIQDHTLSG